MATLNGISFFKNFFAAKPVQETVVSKKSPLIELLQKSVYQGGVFPEISKPQISGIASGIWSDIPSIGRASFDTIAELAQKDFAPGFQTAVQSINGVDMTLAYQLSGVATAVGAIACASGISRDLSAIDRANVLNDRRGVLLGRLSLLKNLTGVGGCLSLGFGFRVCSIISALKGSSTPTLLGRATYGFLFVGLVVFTIFNTLITAICGISIYEGRKLKKSLEACKTPEEKMALLQKKLQVDPSKIQETIEKAKKSGSYSKLLAEAMHAGKKGIKQLLHEMGVENVSDERLGKILVDIFKEPQALVNTYLDLKAATKKQEKLARVLGSDAVQKIRLQNCSVIEGINGALQLNLKENLFTIFTLTLSSAALIAALALTSGAALLAGSILMLVSSIVMLAHDYYYFKKSLAEEQTAPFDKKFVIVSTLTCVATLATFVALTSLGFVTFGTVPLIVALTTTTLWLGYNAYTWHAINQKQAQMKNAPKVTEKAKKAGLELLREAFQPYLIQKA